MNLICGVNPVLEALAAGTRHFDRLLIVKGLRGKRLSEAMRRATRLGIPLRFEMRETLDRMAGGVPHQGIIAIVSEKPVLSLEALLEAVREPALLVVLDGVEDPRNLGAILRTVEAAGGDGVLLPERHSAGLSETVARASAGALEHVKVARVGNLVQALQALKERGIWVVGYDATGSERWDAVDLTKPVALVLGGEGRGMRRLVREHCDHLVSIPHFGHVSSLNVSVAAGVALYEAVRQRKTVPSVLRPIPQRMDAQSRVIGPGPDDDGDTGYDGGPREWGEDEPEADDDVATPAIPHVDFHEDVAWGRGPEVLKEIDFHRAHRAGAGRGDRRGDRRGKPGKGKRRPQQGGAERRGGEGRSGDAAAVPQNKVEEPRPQGEQPPRPQGEQPGDAGEPSRQRGRRRRRRGPRPDAPATPDAPTGKEVDREPRPAPSPSGEGAADGQRRRRRRRRNRH
jgi:23S rRNA (guanosine2251-2'-O)-methyltransferase